VGQQDVRIEGWKSVAAFLNRDRSTVIRWANERGLPVHSLPGGKTRTVYALKDELEAWVLSHRGDPGVADEAPAPRPVVAPAAAPVQRGRVGLWAAGALLLVAAAAGLAQDSVVAPPVAPVEAPQPLDPASDAVFLAARDNIASRSAGRLQAAIVTLERVSARAPRHVGTHEALAEGYLLAREFGSLPDGLAFARTRHEAARALRLDPRSAVAFRAIGATDYWWDRDPAAAGRAFRRAIAAAPHDALAHQWYANALADNGEHAAALREFAAARMLNPGAPYLMADFAWGLWSAGRTREAEAILIDLEQSDPKLASVQDCLSVVAFADGDLAGYADHLRGRATARSASELAAYSAVVDQALARGDKRAVYEVMLSRALSLAEGTSPSDHAWAAFVASQFGDRTQLLTILRHAERGDERWGSAGFVRRIALRWAGDHEIRSALSGLAQARVEPAEQVAAR